MDISEPLVAIDLNIGALLELSILVFHIGGSGAMDSLA